MDNKIISFVLRAKRFLKTGQIRHFEARISHETKKSHRRIGYWADRCVKKVDVLTGEGLYIESKDPVVVQGYRLLQNSLAVFKNKCVSLEQLRVLIHVPPAHFSPGGYSIFKNLTQSLSYLGIASKGIEWEDGTAGALADFKPSVFITSDHPRYLNRIDWPTVKKYKTKNLLMVGLTASLEQYGNSPLSNRLEWAKEKGVNFYYSFRDPDYLKNREEYRPFYDRGYPILTVEFGANPLLYHPIPNITRDLDYVFLASVNRAKWPRYFAFLKAIASEKYGYIDGPGWRFSRGSSMITQRDRFLYARTNVGLNLHLQEQIDWPCELNERTYQLAACGVPQLIDKPALLYKRFKPGRFFVASSPEEYENLFDYILSHPAQAQDNALIAQRDTFAGHTTFHRAEQFALQLKEIMNAAPA